MQILESLHIYYASLWLHGKAVHDEQMNQPGQEESQEEDGIKAQALAGTAIQINIINVVDEMMEHLITALA